MDLVNVVNEQNDELKNLYRKLKIAITGLEAIKEYGDNQGIAKKTLDCLKKNVPSEVPGIAFLSGGQTEIESSKNLNEINKINDTSFHFTFSYGRALQQSALKTWSKSMKDINKIQKVFDHRAKMNSASTEAKWNEKLEQSFAA